MEKDQHGPDKLYEKFHVYKANHVTKDPTYLINQYPEVNRLGADGEFVFVLRPETNDKAAQEAILCYARACENSYPGLAAAITAEITRIRARVRAIMKMGDCTEDEAYRIMAEFRSGATDLPKIDGP